MDNVTHTLAGLLVAEAALLLYARSREAPSSGLRLAACTVSMAANNLPDLDFLYVPITGGKLGYLLHHRGHTHTLAAALPCALLVLFGAWLVMRMRRRSLDAPGWRLLVALAALGPVIHLALDYSNNYGVHPFWPFDNAWYYGDAVFIIEPWFWVSTVPALVYLARSKPAKAVLLLLLGILLVLVWVVPFVPRASSAAVSVGVGVALWSLRRGSAAARVIASFVGSLGVLFVFVVSSRAARASTLELTRTDYPEARVLDVIVSPAPATPLCWNALVLTLEREQYVIRSADVSPLPAWVAAGYCEPPTRGQTAALLAVPNAEQKSAARTLLWRGQLAAPARDLVELARTSCHARALLRFARVPFWRARASRTVLGDLRYDRDEALDFAEIELDAAAACPRFVPPWTPPRSDIPGLAAEYRR